MALGPLEVRRVNQHAVEYRLSTDEFPQAERLSPGSGLSLTKEELPGIDANEVLAVPPAVIISLSRQIFFVPGRKIGIGEQADLEMQVRPFARDALGGIAGSAHGGNDFASFLRLANA